MDNPLTHCPDCGAKANFIGTRLTTECLCGVHLHKDGRVGRICENCGHRHWSDKAAENCRQYLLWNKNKDLIPTWQEKGTKEPRPFYMEGIHWHDIRGTVMKRDKKRCTECGDEFALAVHHIVPRVWGGTEHPRNLRTVCTVCHILAHQKLGVWDRKVSRAMKDSAQQKILAGDVALDDSTGDRAGT